MTSPQHGSTLLLLAFLASPPARADALDSAIHRALAASHIPGAAVAVVRHGKIVKLGGYGLAHVEDGARVTTATRFEIASISKTFIGAAVRLLADEGKLDLEDPLSRYVEDVPESWKPMRLRHLLAMSSGLPEDWSLIPWTDVPMDRDDVSMLAEFRRLKLLSPVGTAWHYSGPGYAMLAMVVSQVSGMPFPTFVAERLLRPAGMTETTYNDPVAVVPGRAEGYRLAADGRTLLRGFHVAPYMHARPDTGMLSTARDLARWVVALESGKIVRDPERLFTPFTSDDGRRDLGYGYGWMTGIRGGRRVVFHTGGFRTGFKSLLVRFPDDDTTIALTSNGRGGGDRIFDAVGVVLGLPDLTASTGADPDPAGTAHLVAGLSTLATHPDATVFGPELTVRDPEDLREVLGQAREVAFVSRRSLAGRPVRWHGHLLDDVLTLRAQTPGETVFLSCYRDGAGLVHAIEPTFR